jgi:hypothetical protein
MLSQKMVYTYYEVHKATLLSWLQRQQMKLFNLKNQIRLAKKLPSNQLRPICLTTNKKRSWQMTDTQSQRGDRLVRVPSALVHFYNNAPSMNLLP